MVDCWALLLGEAKKRQNHVVFWHNTRPAH